MRLMDMRLMDMILMDMRLMDMRLMDMRLMDMRLMDIRLMDIYGLRYISIYFQWMFVYVTSKPGKPDYSTIYCKKTGIRKYN